MKPAIPARAPALILAAMLAVAATGSAFAQALAPREAERIGVIPGYRSADPDAPTVTAENVMEHDGLWPYQVALRTPWTLRDGSRPIGAGTLGVLVRIEPKGLARIDFGRFGRHVVPLAETDIVERANRIREGELEKLAPNLLHSIGPRLLDPSSDPPRDPRLEELYVHNGYLTVFADPKSAEFRDIAKALAPLEGRHGVMTIFFPQGERGNEVVVSTLRGLDWEIPFVLFRFADAYTRSQLDKETALPAIMLQTDEGRVLFESAWEPGVVGALQVAIDVEFGSDSASTQANQSGQKAPVF